MPASPFLPLFLKDFIYVEGSITQRSKTLWFTPNGCSNCDWSQSLELRPRCPREAQLFGHLLLLPQLCPQGAGSETEHTGLNLMLTGMLALLRQAILLFQKPGCATSFSCTCPNDSAGGYTEDRHTQK